MQQLPLYAVIKASLAVLGIGLAVVFVVTAWRPADDRDAFIRTLPPPSEPLAVRAAHLRMQLAQVVKQLVMVYTVIAGVLLVAGVLAALSLNAPIGEGIAAEASVFGLPGVFVAVFSGLYLFARYRGAHRRIRNDAQWHASGDEQTATALDDTGT